MGKSSIYTHVLTKKNNFHILFIDNNEEVIVSLSSGSSSEDNSDVEWVGPVIEVETSNINTTSTVINENTNNMNTSTITNSNAVENGASTSGVTTQTKETDRSGSRLSGYDTDEEEIKDYLRCKPTVSAEEILRGRTGPSPNRSNSAAVASEQNINSANGNEDSGCTLVAPINNEQNENVETPSTSQIAIENKSVITLEISKVESNTQNNQTQFINTDSDNDSDECLFVCAKKPPHLRTPEFVELNSDSDSDVVFVSSEVCQTVKSSHLEKSKANSTALAAHHGTSDVTSKCDGTSTNIIVSNSKRKRSSRRTATTTTTDFNSIKYSSQNTSTNRCESKPSTSKAVLQWFIQSPEKHPRRLSPRKPANTTSRCNFDYYLFLYSLF